jgi:hypothetical protein
VKDDDEFCMQIDAHTIVAKGWDVLLMEQWARYLSRVTCIEGIELNDIKSKSHFISI